MNKILVLLENADNTEKTFPNVDSSAIIIAIPNTINKAAKLYTNLGDYQFSAPKPNLYANGQLVDNYKIYGQAFPIWNGLETYGEQTVILE